MYECSRRQLLGAASGAGAVTMLGGATMIAVPVTKSNRRLQSIGHLPARLWHGPPVRYLIKINSPPLRAPVEHESPYGRGCQSGGSGRSIRARYFMPY